MVARFCCIFLLIASGLAGASPPPNGISVGDLVRRAQIPLATISDDGRFAAYLLVRGNPEQNLYEMSVRVTELRQPSQPVVVGDYHLSPEEVFTDLAWLQSGAGDLYWLPDNTLLFTSKSEGAMRLSAWSALNRRSRIVLEGHHRISLDLGEEPREKLTIVTEDFTAPPPTPNGIGDLAWRMRDEYRFYSPFKNPKTGRWVRTQKWSLSLEGALEPAPEGTASENWELAPEEWQHISAKAGVKFDERDDELAYTEDATPSPDGKRIAMVEIRQSNLLQPDESFASSRVVLKDGDEVRGLTAWMRPYAWTRILGWSPDGQTVYFTAVSPRETVLNAATIDGKVTARLRAPVLYEVPGRDFVRHCRAMSRDGRFAVLVRATNLMPAELVAVDLNSGKVTVLDSPNPAFKRQSVADVRFYTIESGGDLWGRLYLPLDYQPGKHYPLVFTQYGSTPGYYASVGDEAPILPFAANGIAVFAMHSMGVAHSSSVGDLRIDISRVQRPLDGMRWVRDKLVAEGIVDPGRVGIIGLSYGSEITMYAYWKSDLFRAVSSATGSWEPSHYFFGGLEYAKLLEKRGFPAPDEMGLKSWRLVSAGPNARADLPPLLLQSPDGELVASIPSWFQLRHAGAAVEWYEYPEEGHVKRRPANKWWVFERNLDWFRFWLKDEEDEDPAKQDQYRRWREMRAARPVEPPKT